MSSEAYWTVTEGIANRTGWSCRECHSVIHQGEPIIVRDGRKLRLMYHGRCYSGQSDPRTQAGSSYHGQKWLDAQSIRNRAPSVKGYGKWACGEYGYRGDSYGRTSKTVKHESPTKDRKEVSGSKMFH